MTVRTHKQKETTTRNFCIRSLRGMEAQAWYMYNRNFLGKSEYNAIRDIIDYILSARSIETTAQRRERYRKEMMDGK